MQISDKPKRLKYVKAFHEELKVWRCGPKPLSPEQLALITVFCAGVGLRMKGTSMDEILKLESD